MTQDRERQWQDDTAAATERVAARVDVHTHQAQRVPVWHDGKPIKGSVLRRRGHATGAAIVLSLDGQGAFGPGAITRVVMAVEAAPGVDGAAVESPPVPWFAHAITCAGCGQVVKARGDKLLSGAVDALAPQGETAGPFRVYV